MPAACALGMISGKYIFNFGIAERLRTFRYAIFPGGVVTENGSSSACFLRKRGAAGTAKAPIYEKDREHTLFFYAKNHRKHLKVLFIVSLLCDTVFTGKAPGTKQTHRRETP